MPWEWPSDHKGCKKWDVSKFQRDLWKSPPWEFSLNCFFSESSIRQLQIMWANDPFWDHLSVVSTLPPQNHNMSPRKICISRSHPVAQTCASLCDRWIILNHPQPGEPHCLPGRVFIHSRFLREESGNRCLGRWDDPELMKDFIKTDKNEHKQGRCPWIK